MTNEKFVQRPIVNSPQQLHKFDFSAFLSNYFTSNTTAISLSETEENWIIVPNLVNDFLHVQTTVNLQSKSYRVMDMNGIKILTGFFTNDQKTIDLKKVPSGSYLLQIGEGRPQRFQYIRN
jgi:hypothetical protein